VANLPLVSTQAELVANFAAGVVDTGGKFAAGVLDWRISPRIFEKIQNDPYVIFRGMGEDDS
jgi:hypothetical protein